MSSSKFIIKWLEARVKKIERECVDDVSQGIEIDARRNYNRAKQEVPADDPIVNVVRSSNGKEATVSCSGNQVLFIEFGAGKKHSYETKMTTTAGYATEKAPRPSGIVDIGNYGKGYGKNDSWKYKSQTGRESLHSHLYRFNKNGEPIMITSGIRPIRALWNAINSAMRRYAIGSMGRRKLK